MNPLASLGFQQPSQEDEDTQLQRLLAYALNPQQGVAASVGQQDALSRQSAFGNLSLLSGDSVLAPFGREQLADVARAEPLTTRNATLALSAQRLALQREEEQRKLELLTKKYGQDAGYRDRELKLKEKQAAQRTSVSGGAGPKEKQMSGTEAERIGDINTAITMMQELKAAHAKLANKGMGGRLMSALNAKSGMPLDRGVADFNALRGPTMQFVGRSLEGVSLRKEDEEKYDRMLTYAGDDAAMGATKADAVIRQLNIKKQELLAAQQNAGYDTHGFQTNPQAPRQPDVSLDTTPSAPVRRTAAQILLQKTQPPPAAEPKDTDAPAAPGDDVAMRELNLPTEIARTGESTAAAYERTIRGFEKDFPPFQKIVQLVVPKDAEPGYIKSNVKEGEIVRVGQGVVQKKNGGIVYIVKPQSFLSAADKKKYGLK